MMKLHRYSKYYFSPKIVPGEDLDCAMIGMIMTLHLNDLANTRREIYEDMEEFQAAHKPLWMGKKMLQNF